MRALIRYQATHPPIAKISVNIASSGSDATRIKRSIHGFAPPTPNIMKAGNAASANRGLDMSEYQLWSGVEMIKRVSATV